MSLFQKVDVMMKKYIMHPKISFVIAVYNNTKYLSVAVHSVNGQVIPNKEDIEIVIVDDGSTDDTPQLADSLAERDNRITVIHQQNQWIYASFNNGIKAARGEYIYILNSDDKLIDGAVQILLDSIESFHHPDVIWTKVIWQDVDENQRVLSEHDMNATVSSDEYFPTIDLVRDKWLFVQTSGVAVNQANLYKRDLAIKYPFRNDYYAGDSFFNIGIADDIKSMAFLVSPVYQYLAYNNGQLNASIGKYYGYEHEMFNELMMQEFILYEKWGRLDALIDNLALRRLREMTYELETLCFQNCMLLPSEKIIYVFARIADEKIRRVASKVGREKEYESRILTGVKNLICKLNAEMSVPEFVKILISYLPDNYLDNVDKSKLDYDLLSKAIECEKNPDRIGKIYYFEDW